MSFPGLNEQMDEIRKGAAEILPEELLEKKISRSISTGKPLQIKFGADPSAPDLHIGHAVVINKLKTFQQLGHQVIFLIGDFTGMVGDPTGKSKTRPRLTREQVLANAETYKSQIFKLLDPEKTQIRFNSEWFEKMPISQFLELTSRYTVARLLEREDFSRRYKTGQPIAVIEFLYPLIQGYDSVALEADVELGGTDQTFNLLVGRVLQEHYAQEPQVILTMPILEGTDGVNKMSKSLDNYIGITDNPREIFGRTMSIPDELIARWYELATDLPAAEVREIRRQLEAHEVNPSHLKRRLGRELVRIYHDVSQGEAAEQEFNEMFKQGGLPEDMPEFSLTGDTNLPDLLTAAELVKSKGEARKLVRQGAVSLDGEKISDETFTLGLAQAGAVLKVGKRRFLKLVAGA
jgi:tyrosyl-tRNA synthetase